MKTPPPSKVRGCGAASEAWGVSIGETGRRSEWEGEEEAVLRGAGSALPKGGACVFCPPPAAWLVFFFFVL